MDAKGGTARSPGSEHDTGDLRVGAKQGSEKFVPMGTRLCPFSYMSYPNEFVNPAPQQTITPDARNAHVCHAPAVTEMMPNTALAGMDVWFREFWPQQMSCP